MNVTVQEIFDLTWFDVGYVTCNLNMPHIVYLFIYLSGYLPFDQRYLMLADVSVSESRNISCFMFGWHPNIHMYLPRPRPTKTRHGKSGWHQWLMYMYLPRPRPSNTASAKLGHALLVDNPVYLPLPHHLDWHHDMLGWCQGPSTNGLNHPPRQLLRVQRCSRGPVITMAMMRIMMMTTTIIIKRIYGWCWGYWWWYCCIQTYKS